MCLLLAPAHEQAGCFCVVMIKEEAFARIKCGDRRHILVGKREIEDIDVLSHPLDMGRFGNDDDIALN